MVQIEPRIVVEIQEDVIIIELNREKILDEQEIQAFEHSIMPILKEAGAGKFVLDFGRVEFLSSAVLGLLIRISKHVYQQGGKLGLCGIKPKILEIFKITRLDRVFEIFSDRDGAIAGLK